MLEFVFNGMVFLLLGLQMPGILETSLVAAEADPNVETRMLFVDIGLIYFALMIVRFGWLWTMKRLSMRFLKKKPMEFGSGAPGTADFHLCGRARGDHSCRCALHSAAAAER